MLLRRYLPPLIVLLVGLTASLLAAWQLAGAAERRSLARFEGLAASARTAVANKMDMQLALLRGGAGLFSGSDEVSPDEFRRYVEGLGLGRHYPGILGIGFAEAGVTGRAISQGARSGAGLQSSIRFLEPMSPRNSAALGIDMLSEMTRRDAMLRAWNTGQPALTGIVRLVQETEPGKQPGVLLYLPLRDSDGAFRGWIYSPLRGADLFGSVVTKPEFEGVRVAVYDTQVAPSNRLFESEPEPDEARHRQVSAVEVAGRRLLVEVTTLPSFAQVSPVGLPLLVGLLGALITLLLATLAWQQQRTVSRIEEQVRQRTSELREANARLQAESRARTEAEEQLHQAQKREAVGQLTGGIAHDFNNMLAVVIGSLDFARHTDDPGKLRRLIEQALKGAGKAAELTQRLLAFSRRQTLLPAVVDPGKLVAEMSDLLDRTLGGAIRLETVLPPGSWQIFADPAQLESAILNLAVNARDAMPEGGTLTIETANCDLSEDYARARGVEPGPYALIAVSDTGAGMTPEVQARATEPFFTTKDVGHGTGLGLSQVFGFVKQSGGHLNLHSEPGNGTTIKIYLPRHRGEQPAISDRDSRSRELPRGDAKEVVLTVEDDEDVRLMSVEALRALGYTVIHASNGAKALRCLEANPGVRLVFTDIVMPEMGGEQLAAEVRDRFPHVRLLFTTGFRGNAAAQNGRLQDGREVIAKPFTVEQLARRVRGLLDA